jgi:hypothetical protein
MSPGELSGRARAVTVLDVNAADERLRELIREAAREGARQAVREVLASQGSLVPRSDGEFVDSARPQACAVVAKVRGCEPWEVARELAEAYIKNHPWPGLNQLARQCNCHHSVLKKAIGNSKLLQQAEAAQRLQKARPAARQQPTYDPSWEAQVDEALRQLMECAPAERRAELNTPDMREELGRMEPDALASLVDDARQSARRHRIIGAHARTPAYHLNDSLTVT